MMETTSRAYRIHFDEAIGSVVMEWHGYATSSEFKEGTELMLNTLIRHNTFKVLADIRNMTIIAGEDQDWLHSAFLPRPRW